MPHILVVDDSRVERQIARGLLEKEPGWTVSTAEDGIEALEQIEEQVPDLVLTDMQMPNMDGLKLVECIRNEYPLIPVVLMTAAGSESIAVTALQRGAASYVSKSDFAVDLVGTLKRVLATSHRGRSRRRLLNHLRELHYEIENDPELISAVAAEIRELIQERCLFDENECLRMATAVEEALQLALRLNLDIDPTPMHSEGTSESALLTERCTQEPWKHRHIWIRVNLTRDQVLVSMQHSGRPFDRNGYTEFPQEGSMTSRKDRSFQLLRALADEVQFEDQGTGMTLIKYTRWVDESMPVAVD
jgi:CheY-like chemotaxis protein